MRRAYRHVTHVTGAAFQELQFICRPALVLTPILTPILTPTDPNLDPNGGDTGWYVKREGILQTLDSMGSK